MEFKPGFRISAIDAVILIIADAASKEWYFTFVS